MLKFKLKRFYAVAIAVLLSASPLSAAGAFDNAIANFAGSRAMQGAKIGICVMDLNTGKAVAGKNGSEAIIPASVMKLITSAAAIKMLSPQFCFCTNVKYDGYIDHKGVLQGNLIIEGGIDPTLDSRHFPELEPFAAQCIRQLKQKGISSIAGKIIIREEACPEPAVPEAWEDSDVAETYGAGIHALNYADNQFSLIIDVANLKAEIIDTVPKQYSLKIDNRLEVSRKGGRFRAYRRKNGNTLRLSGRIKRQEEPIEIWTTMPHPAEALLYDLSELLASEGIRIGNKSIDNKKVETLLFRHSSPELSDIVRSLLFRSDNMYAEAVLRAIALYSGTAATRKMAVEKERQLLSQWGIDTKGQTLYDGSGLARDNRISPLFLANVLAMVFHDERYGNLFPTLLPNAGQDGTVKKLLKGTCLEGQIALKSGSMNGVQCYAGFYPAISPEYAVVLMVNNYHCNYDNLKKSIETLFLEMFATE